MNQAAMETTAKVRPTGLASAGRSAVLGEFRSNPFRVLRVPIDVGVDQAIWKAEEVLTRLRAGLPSADADLLPWLPETDETETRQAVQRIEEPLRRLTDQMFWFDPEHEPDGDLLRQGLVSLDPTSLGEYLVRLPDDGLSNPLVVRIPRQGENGVCSSPVGPVDLPLTAEVIRQVEPSEVPRLLDHANLRLLLATLSLYDALPEGLEIPADPVGENGRVPAEFDWESSDGLTLAEDPQKLVLDQGKLAARQQSSVALWAEALDRWLRLAGSPAFLAHIKESIARLDDEVVGEDDAEAIANSASARLMDLFVGEVKAQLLLGRMDRVRVLLEAAGSSHVEPPRLSRAFRPLRPLFRTEADELEPLLTSGDLAIDDVRLYLSRLGTLKARWEAIDPSGHLGLAEVVDEAALKACESLARLESYSTVAPLKTLYGAAMGLASAESLKQKIAATVTRINGFEHYSCYFCQTREMDVRRSVVITGKIESHRTYGFNSTTIHYMLKADLIPRCPRCSELHQYLIGVRGTTWAALAVGAAAAIGVVYARAPVGQEPEAAAYFFLAGIAAVVIWIVGLLARWVVAMQATPSGERPYWKATKSEKYYNMSSGQAKMTIDYRRDAFRYFEDQHGKQQG